MVMFLCFSAVSCIQIFFPKISKRFCRVPNISSAGSAYLFFTVCSYSLCHKFLLLWSFLSVLPALLPVDWAEHWDIYPAFGFLSCLCDIPVHCWFSEQRHKFWARIILLQSLAAAVKLLEKPIDLFLACASALILPCYWRWRV